MREAFSRETTEGTVYNVSGGDWEDALGEVQCLPALVVGGLLSDVIPCIASVDSLMGGCDR